MNEFSPQAIVKTLTTTMHCTFLIQEPPGTKSLFWKLLLAPEFKTAISLVCM